MAAIPPKRRYLRDPYLIAPPVGFAVFTLVQSGVSGGLWLAIAVMALISSIVAAIHHAEVIAHRTGEPFGSLVLAVSITIIEVGLIVSLMLASAGSKTELARDAIYAAVMILCNGVIGSCLLLGAWKHREQNYRVEGAASALATLVALAILTLVLPNFTTSASGALYSTQQLAFVAIVSLVLYFAFVKVQSGRHRDYFLPVEAATSKSEHAPPPTVFATWLSFGSLVLCLLSVVGLAKSLSPNIEGVVTANNLPASVVGVAIALLVLMPESGAALRAAFANRFQTSMNLSLGSALASIGLTIPAVAVVSLWLNMPLTLGLQPRDMVLLALTFFVCAVTLTLGRTNLVLGVVHLVLFFTFVFMTLVP